MEVNFEKVHDVLVVSCSQKQGAWYRDKDLSGFRMEWLDKSVGSALQQKSSSKIEVKHLQEGSETSNVVTLRDSGTDHKNRRQS